MASIPTSPGVYRLSRPSDRYDPVSRVFSRSQLSARAIKLGLYILSHRDGFTQSQDEIGRVIAMSPKTVRAALVDLEDAGHLVRHEIRNDEGHRIGTAYGITDEPISGLTVDPPPGENPPGEFTGHKESRSRRDTTLKKKTNPSGGSSADAAAPTLEASPTHSEETPVVAPVAQDALFDVPAEKTARKRDEGPSARTVVAAYVDSYRKHHAGADPSKAFLGRVARSAKAALESGAAAPDELTAAAGAMGEGPYANLDVALSIFRQGGRRRVQTSSPALPHTDPAWVAVAQQVDSDTYQRLLVDDELVQWMAGDQSEVDKWVFRHPELASRFATVA